MKKSSIFIIIISFIVSIFTISFFGSAIRDEQFTIYFESVEIVDVDVLEVPGEEFVWKYKEIEFKEDIENCVYIHVKTLPEVTTASDGYEFFIDSNDIETKEVDGTIYQNAELIKNCLIFNWPCSVTVWVRTTDGSAKKDYCTFSCVEPQSEN